MRRLAWGFLSLLAACAGTETGNPSFRGSLGYDAYSSSPDVVLRGSALQGVTEVQSSWLVLGDVDFLSQAHCDSAAPPEHPVHGIGAGDHVGSQAQPSELQLDSGEYCAVHLPLLAAETTPDNAPAGLRGHSLLVSGTLADGRHFELRSALERELVLRGAHDFELDGGHPGVLVGFDVAAWLYGLDWDGAEADGDVGIIADETRNAALLEAFEQQFASGVSLFRDADRDGLLDPDPVAIAHGE